jgi:hypothetical protein
METALDQFGYSYDSDIDPTTVNVDIPCFRMLVRPWRTLEITKDHNLQKGRSLKVRESFFFHIPQLTTYVIVRGLHVVPHKSQILQRAPS